MNRERKNLLSDIMQEDDKDGLYNTQTAVDWLIEQYKKDGLFKQGVYEQAIAMEKEQIMKAYDDGAIETMKEQEGLDISKDQNGEESGKYYNKKYNK
jgi:cell division protein YceG involved in septum cleavage